MRGEEKLIFFALITFFLNGRVRQEGGGDPGQLKKFRQGGYMRGFTKYF